MNLCSLQPLAFLCSLILALPSGWCGGCFAGDDRAESHQGQSGCCVSLAQPQTPPGERAAAEPLAPASPVCECCSSWQATVPIMPTAPDDEAPAALTLAVRTALPAATIVEITTVPLRHGLRLHVLKCVWRC